MAYHVPPRVSALKRCMGWYPEVYNAASASLSDGAAVGEGAAPSFFPLPPCHCDLVFSSY